MPLSGTPRLALKLSTLLLAGLVLACSESADAAPATAGNDPSQPKTARERAAKAAYDHAVSQGGWDNGGQYPLIGDPNAKQAMKDRPLKVPIVSFPPTLRREGPNSRLVTIRTLNNLQFETLVDIHPETLEFIPLLAKEWKIERDQEAGKQTFWFRLDPDARFSDGSKVTANDVYYSFWHLVQKDRNDPSNYMTFHEGYEDPVVVDESTIRVTTKSLNWRLFLYFGADIRVYPAKYVHIPGKKFLEEYDWKYWPGSGPYIMRPEDLKKGDSVTLTRRADWWAKDKRWATGLYNFHKIRFVVIRDRELQYEKFKAGELDWFLIARAQRWVEDVPKERIVKKGWVQQRRVFNEAPEGIMGLAFNTRKPPFKDIRVREAFCYLFNREKLFKKLFFNQYKFIDSIYPGRDWGNGDKNPKIRFDPDKAEELLWEAGYKKRDDDGYLIGPDGKRLEVTLEFAYQSWERIWLVVKEDYEEAGIKFNLKLIDQSTRIKKVGDRQFDITFQAWTGLLFPNPETTWSSKLANQLQNNNITGFADPTVDKLMAQYNVTFERAKQKELTRQIDAIVFSKYQFAYGWYANFMRMLYWNRFGHPKNYVRRIGDQLYEEVILLWWWDPQKDAVLRKAMKDKTDLPRGPIDVHPWDKKSNGK